jgi:MFS family permease
MALGMSSAPVIVLLGGIVGVALAPSPALSILPVAMLVVGVALLTVPAALIMRRIGRRTGFIAALLVAAITCILGIYAIHAQSFFLFSVVAFLIGGTTLLTRCYGAAERFKAQALNDLAVFGFQALASLSAGTVIFLAGWEVVNGVNLPFLMIMMGIIWKLRVQIDS